MSSSKESPSSSFQWDFNNINDRDFTIKGQTILFIIVLFASVFFVVLIYFSVQRLFRGPSTPPHTLPTFRPIGLDKTSIRALPVTLHNQQKVGQQGECCICLGVFEDGDKVKVLPQCQHCYHDECVDKWLTTQSSCPLCRTLIRVDSSLA